MEIKPFLFQTNPLLEFGWGKFSVLPDIIDTMGANILIVTGNSFRTGRHWEPFMEELAQRDITPFEWLVSGEPSADWVDEACEEFRPRHIHAVVAIGGGSALDAGKAISAMLPQRFSVREYLEGIGKKKHDGVKAPFIAVPTTSGTGSEATRNAVLNHIGPKGFKKSLRHDNLIADAALVDPELSLTCPEGVTAASGLDAVTQLIESYVSPRTSPIITALCESGLTAAGHGFPAVIQNPDDREARTSMSYAAYISGVTLSNAGLGVVHGAASVLGAYYDIPHGVVCGTLLADSVALTVKTLDGLDTPESHETRRRYASAGRALFQLQGASESEAVQGLVQGLTDWVSKTEMPRLSEFGIETGALDKLTAEIECKQHPVRLSPESIRALLQGRI